MTSKPRFLASQRPSITFAAFVAVMAIVPVARAGQNEPDPLEIIKKADEVTRRVRAVTYEFEHFGVGDIADRVPFLEGTVSALKGRVGILQSFGRDGTWDDRHDSIRITGTVKTRDLTRKFDVATDGYRNFSVDFEREIYIQGDQEAHELLKPLRPLFMLEFFHPTPFTDEMIGVSREYEGIEKVGDVDCHVIYVKYQRPWLDAKWYFSVEDHLPRRVDRMIFSNGKRIGARALIVKKLNISPKFSHENFIPPVPEGFSRRAYRPEDAELLAVGSVAPEFELKTPDGMTVRLSALRGRVVVLDFWASWCAPCQLTMPQLQKLKDKFNDRPLEILAINCSETIDNPGKYFEEKGMTYKCLLDGESVARDYRVKSLPALIVVGADGHIVHVQSGYVANYAANLEGAIDSALEGAKAGGYARQP